MHRLHSLRRRTPPWYRREEGLTVVEWVGMVAVMVALLMTMMVFFSQRGNLVATATLDAMHCHIQMVGGAGNRATAPPRVPKDPGRPPRAIRAVG